MCANVLLTICQRPSIFAKAKKFVNEIPPQQPSSSTTAVSDFSSKEIDDPKQSAKIAVTFGDGRRGVVVADAHIEDKLVQEIVKVGRQQARRGRRPKIES